MCYDEVWELDFQRKKQAEIVRDLKKSLATAEAFGERLAVMALREVKPTQLTPLGQLIPFKVKVGCELVELGRNIERAEKVAA